MSKFIELTSQTGCKHYVKVDKIERIDEYKDGIKVVLANDILYAEESFETVKGLIDNDINVGDKDKVVSIKVTKEEVKEALTAWQRKDCFSSSCEDCKYNRNATVDECEAMFVTDYLNGRYGR